MGWAPRPPRISAGTRPSPTTRRRPRGRGLGRPSAMRSAHRMRGRRASDPLAALHKRSAGSGRPQPWAYSDDIPLLQWAWCHEDDVVGRTVPPTAPAVRSRGRAAVHEPTNSRGVPFAQSTEDCPERRPAPAFAAGQRLYPGRGARAARGLAAAVLALVGTRLRVGGGRRGARRSWVEYLDIGGFESGETRRGTPFAYRCSPTARARSCFSPASAPCIRSLRPAACSRGVW